MKVYLNQTELFVGTRCCLRDLLAGQSITSETATVAVNNRVIPKEEWHSTMLANDDKVTVMAHSTYGSY